MSQGMKLVTAVVVCLLVGVFGSFFTMEAIPIWYAELNKPSFNPPSWLFGPVWTTLYALMGVALFLVWRQGIKSKKARTAVILFGIQLALNSLWSIVFFGLKQPLWAFIEIIVLWIMILLTMVRFYKLSKQAAYLLIPYLVWVSFAAFLNYFIVKLN